DCSIQRQAQINERGGGWKQSISIDSDIRDLPGSAIQSGKAKRRQWIRPVRVGESDDWRNNGAKTSHYANVHALIDGSQNIQRGPCAPASEREIAVSGWRVGHQSPTVSKTIT